MAQLTDKVKDWYTTEIKQPAIDFYRKIIGDDYFPGDEFFESEDRRDKSRLARMRVSFDRAARNYS